MTIPLSLQKGLTQVILCLIRVYGVVVFEVTRFLHLKVIKCQAACMTHPGKHQKSTIHLLQKRILLPVETVSTSRMTSKVLLIMVRQQVCTVIGLRVMLNIFLCAMLTIDTVITAMMLTVDSSIVELINTVDKTQFLGQSLILEPTKVY